MGNLMVKLQRGYGDGYGIVAASDDGLPKINAAQKHDGYYRDDSKKCGRMEEWRSAILSKSSVTLLDGGVNVPASAIVRVIGPADGIATSRIRAKRYTRNWFDAQFVADASDEELHAAMSHECESAVYAAMTSLREKYRGVNESASAAT